MSEHRKRNIRIFHVALIVLLLFTVPFIYHNLWTFYSGSWEQFKTWYPRIHIIVFPIVKLLPFLFVGALFWLTRHTLSDGLRITTTWIFNNLQNIIITLATISISLIIAEFVLRKQGFKPGYRIYSPYFKPVDSLYTLSGFISDSNGILRISPDAGKFICEELERKDCIYDLNPFEPDQAVEVYSIPHSFVAFHSYNHKSALKTFLKTVQQPPVDTNDIDFFDAVKHYVHCPVNSDGFKSIEFKKYRARRKSLLLIGDSFTWGHAAENLTNSFADLLLAKGYVVFNTGISATDPSQYLEIATTFTNALQPDVVIVNFYLGNDVMYFERKLKPFMPVVYSTNAGNLLSCPEGVYFEDAAEAYRYTYAHFMIPQDNRLNVFASKTVLTTLTWSAITEWKPQWTMNTFREYYLEVNKLKQEVPFSDTQIEEIEKVATQSGAKFLLAVIPLFNGQKFIYPEDYPVLLENIPYHVPPVSSEHYEKRNDGHYNDLGHALHAQFIDSLVRSLP